MDVFGITIWVIWFVGLFVSWFVYYSRCGLATFKRTQGIDWREFLLPNIPYWIAHNIKAILWPVVFIYWLVRGRPDCPWVATTTIQGKETRKILRRDKAEALGIGA